MPENNRRRHSAFESWGTPASETYAPPAPPTPIDLIGAEPQKRDRGWDNRHRAWSYKIPDSLRQRAMDVREAINGIAQSGSSTTDEIANALIALALSHVDRGALIMHGHPDPRRQKMAVVWEESKSSWPQEIPSKKAHTKKQVGTKKSLYLAYRWPGSVHQQICRISGNTLARGEVVVVLLQHSLEAYRRGSLRLKFQPRTMVIGERS